jgi:uncharacterized surface protein with fasciclin (FAS1) repeats
MKHINGKNKLLTLLALGGALMFGSCNKGINDIPDISVPESTGSLLGDTLRSNANDSLYYRLVLRSGLLSTINNKAANYTLFVPDNNGMKLFINAISGGAVPLNAPDAIFSGFISTQIPVPSAQAIVAYNTVPQKLPFDSIPAVFPNLQYPTIYNPAPSISSLLRLTTYPSRMNGNWVNNIPVLQTDLMAKNGVIHHTATIVAPPSRFIWDRINTDPDLTIFKAALQRADSGVTATGGLQGALANIGANFTVLAPTNQAMKNVISFLSQGLLTPTDPDASFIGFLGSPFVTTQMVKGIAVYHMFDGFKNTASADLFIQRPGRFFTNNLPVTATAYPTLLSSASTTTGSYPPVLLQASFGPMGATAATAKGAFNPSPSNFLINPTPDPYGTSDQHFLNGTLHEIDQVLIPSL